MKTQIEVGQIVKVDNKYRRFYIDDHAPDILVGKITDIMQTKIFPLVVQILGYYKSDALYLAKNLFSDSRSGHYSEGELLPLSIEEATLLCLSQL